MTHLDSLAHGDANLTARTGCFFELLIALSQPEKQDTIAARMAGFLGEPLQEQITLDDLSTQFHFSKNHIINLFRQSYNTTPTDYLNAMRLQKTMHLLEATSDSAEDIAVACGFRSYSHFYRMFLRRNQLPPTAWRQQKRLSH